MFCKCIKNIYIILEVMTVDYKINAVIENVIKDCEEQIKELGVILDNSNDINNK